MLFSKIQDSQKLALPYLTKWRLKRYLGREQSSGKDFRVQFSIFSEKVLKIDKYQPNVAYKSVVYKIKSVYKNKQLPNNFQPHFRAIL